MPSTAASWPPATATRTAARVCTGTTPRAGCGRTAEPLCTASQSRCVFGAGGVVAVVFGGGCCWLLVVGC